MNKKNKLFIINNQEDEDGFNMNPGKIIMHENVKSVFEVYPGNNTVNKKSGIVKRMPGALFSSALVSEMK